MNLQPLGKYKTVAVYAAIVAALAVVGFFFFINFYSILASISAFFASISPLIIAFCAAYLLNPLVKLFEKKLFFRVGKKNGKTYLRRFLSVAVTFIVVVVALGAIIWLFVPQLAASYNELSGNMDRYIGKISEWAGSFMQDMDAAKVSEGLYSALDSVKAAIDGLMDNVLSYLATAVKTVADITIGAAVAFCFLMHKESIIDRMKYALSVILRENKYTKLMKAAKVTDNTFGGFMAGKILDSLIVGLATFICLAIFNVPYYPLIAVIMTVTNMIPYFGPFIGAIPSGFIVLIADPTKVIAFVLIVLIIQQIDGNILVPKIIGDSIGLGSFWVIIAITVMGGLFGLVGLLLGEPLFALLYTFVRYFINARLEKRGVAEGGAGGSL